MVIATKPDNAQSEAEHRTLHYYCGLHFNEHTACSSLLLYDNENYLAHWVAPAVELLTPLVRSGCWSQWICHLPAIGSESVTESEGVEHLCHLLHSLLLHKHIPTPLCYELARLTRKQRCFHDGN